MTTQGILIIDLLAVCLLALVLHLLRKRALFIRLALLWIVPLLALLAVINVPPLLRSVTRVAGALFPVSALSLLAFVFIFFVLILFSVQLCRLQSRQNDLVYFLALKEFERDDSMRDRDSHRQPNRK